MSRFLLKPDAERDLLDIRAYLDLIPTRYSTQIARALIQMFRKIGGEPFLGTEHSQLTLLAGQEVRSRRVQNYRIFYTMQGKSPEILGIIHTSRDLPTIMEKRLQ